MPEQIQQVASKLPTIVSSQPIIEWVDSEWLSHRLDVRFYESRFLKNLAELSTLQMKRTSLKHLAKLDGGGAFPAAEFSDSGPIPTAKIGDITHQRYPDEWVRLSYQAFEKFGKAETRYPDVLITMTGDPPDVGKCMMVPQWDTLTAYNQRVARVRFDSSGANSFYVCAFMSTEWARLQLEKVCTGIRQRHVTLDDIRRIIVPLPPRPVQEYIGAKVRLAERCRARARELRQQVQDALNKWYKEAPIELTKVHSFLVEPLELDSPRLDSWHYQPHYRRVVQWCRQHQFIPVSSIASLAKRRWSPKQSQQSSFHYTEISDVDISTGRVEGKELLTSEAPGRARQLIRAFDVLISTVRPERKGVGIASVDMEGWVASTGFSILETETPEMAHFLCATLRHDVSTLQMMRWNTGATYPAIDADVPLDVLVPNLSSEARSEIGKGFQSAIKLDNRAADLVRKAKADVEALIEGRLDVEAIVAGRVQPPTWKDVEV